MTDFGRDLACLDKIDPRRTVSGSRAVAENAWRCMRTRRGQLLDDPEFGCREVLSLGARMDRTRVASMEQRIAAALRHDERIGFVAVRLSEVARNQWRVDVSAQTAAGPFRLVGSVSDVGPKLLEIG